MRSLRAAASAATMRWARRDGTGPGADHHAHASRPYFALRHLDDSPQLPAGYSSMLLVALVPPLWRHVMDARVDGWRAHKSHASIETSPAE